MRLRKVIIGAAIVVLGLPLALVVAGTAVVAVLDRANGTLEVLGHKREYLLYVPKSYDRAKPTPLVISLHGAMTWPAFQMHVSRWNAVAERNGFLVVYPGGTGTGPKVWTMEGWRHPSQMPDVRFIAALIDTLEARYHVDPARIYANGFSNGGGMAFALSCTLSGRIAAIGAVSAAQSLPWSWCADSTPVPLIEFHGTADPFVPYDGAGTGWLNPAPFPNIRRWNAEWARRNRCSPQAVDSAVASGVVRTQYVQCADGASVVLYTIRGGGHQWPGGKPLPRWFVGPASPQIDATALMWAFFQEHPLARR